MCFEETKTPVFPCYLQYEKVLKAFGEDLKKVQADEFFGTFDQFLAYFCEAKIENRRHRRMKEEEAKRASFEEQVSACARASL